jgi:hypothetical protein
METKIYRVQLNLTTDTGSLDVGKQTNKQWLRIDCLLPRLFVTVVPGCLVILLNLAHELGS